MKTKILTILIVLMSFIFLTTAVDAAKRFDVTDISYSYVSYNYPYYPNAQYYNNYNYYNSYGYYDYGYINTYTGYTTYYPIYTYPVYTYPTYYPTYNNISYVTPQTQVTFSWN